MKKIIKVLAATAATMVLLTGCSFTDGKVKETHASPDGSYIVEETDYGIGMLFGHSGIVLRKDGNEPQDLITIEDATAKAGTDYEVDWDSDESFTVRWQEAEDEIRFARGDIDDCKCKTVTGKVSIDREQCVFHDFSTFEDKVYYSCFIGIKNTYDKPIDVKLSAVSQKDKGKLLEDGTLNCSKVLTVAPYDTIGFEVALVGKKGPDDQKADRFLPNRLILTYAE